MVVRNDLDRFHLVIDVMERVPKMAERRADITQKMREKREAHRQYITRYGCDMPEVADWMWGAA